jgi:hypothetical protein
MNRWSRVVVAAVLAAGVMSPGGGAGAVVKEKQEPSSVQVCLDSSSGVVSRVALSNVCVGGIQNWSASDPAPLLCWDASSLLRLNQSRLVSAAPIAGCVAPLRPIPVGRVSLLCADRVSGVLRWPVTGTCRFGNQDVFVRSAAAQTIVPATSTTAVLVPSVSLAATLIDGGTFPKAAVVTSNVAGTVYFIEGASPVNTVSDITSAPIFRWSSGVIAANTPTSIALDVNVLTNGYYRVFVANNQGVLSAPALNNVTISISRASDVAALSCALGGTCIVGDPGPGGGVVFYVALTTFISTGSPCNTECKYMEAAPIGWIVSSAPAGQTNCAIAGSSTVDPKCAWSGNTTNSVLTTSALIGKGHANTTAMIAQSSGGSTAGKAATVSRAYQGGGKTDWFLPSKDELNQMCKWQRGVDWISDATVCRGGVLNTGRGASGFSADVHWSSTEDAQYDAWFQYFNNGLQGKDYHSRKRSEFYIRPARAF